MASGNSGDQTVQESGLTAEQAARLAGRITELRKLAGLTVEQLAVALRMSRSSAYNLINGEKEPSLSEMLLAVRALKLHSIEELLGPLGTGEFLRLAPSREN